MVFTVYGRVGIGRRRQHVRLAATLMMSGAWPPPAPSVWYVWIVRPLNAATLASTKPDSFSVSVWIATCTSISSATERQLSIAAGVVPQSSCSFNPMAPARTCSRSGSGSDALPLPRKPRFIGNASAASSIECMCHGPGVQVVAIGAGRRPGAAAEHRGDARHQRFLDLLRADEVDVAVDAAGGDDHAFARDHLGAGADRES